MYMYQKKIIKVENSLLAIFALYTRCFVKFWSNLKIHDQDAEHYAKNLWETLAIIIIYFIVNRSSTKRASVSGVTLIDTKKSTDVKRQSPGHLYFPTSFVNKLVNQVETYKDQLHEYFVSTCTCTCLFVIIAHVHVHVQRLIKNF